MTEQRLLDATFGRLALCAGVFFVAMGATFPVLPRYVRDELGRGDTAVGFVLGAMAIGAIIARPTIGQIGDRRGRVTLLVIGGSVASAAMLGHLVAGSVGVLILLRVVLGVGQGALVVGATTFAVDLAPAERSGEATSYIFVALHLGTGIGSVLGEWLLRQWSFNAVWIAAGLAMAASGAIGATLPQQVPDTAVASSEVGLFHPRAVLPGAILGIGILGFIGFSAFVPLYADELGIENVAPFFLAASLTIVAIRGFGARLPDRLGPHLGGSAALLLSSAGLALIGLWRSAVGLTVGTIILAAGTALLLPSLVTAAVDGVRLTERSRALATYTLFLELSTALGAVLFGGVAATSSYGAAFVVSAVAAAAAFVILQLTFGRNSEKSASKTAPPIE